MILKNVPLPTGAVANFHKVHHIQQVYPFTHTNIEVYSYASEEAFLNGSGSMWVHRMSVEALDTTGTLIETVEAWLLGSPESEFVGGQLAIDNSLTVDAAQARKWADVKALRTVYESGVFMFEGALYDANTQKITGAATLAVMAKMAGKEFSTSWTLADNSVRFMTGDDLMALGVAVGEYVDGLYEKARALRVEIFAAETIEAVDAITWAPPYTNAIPATMTAPGPTPTARIMAAATPAPVPAPAAEPPVMDTLALVPHTPAE